MAETPTPKTAPSIDAHCASDQDRAFEAAADRLSVLAGRINAIEAELVDAVADAIEAGAWAGAGVRSVRQWLTVQLGVSRSHAHRLEAVARRVGEFPLTADQFRAGLLSFDQLHAVVTEAPAWADVHAYELVKFATEPQIRRIIRAQFPDGYQPITPATADDAVDQTTDHTADDEPGDDDGGDVKENDTVDGADTEINSFAITDGTADAINDVEGVAAGAFRSRFSSRWTTDGRYVGSFDLPADLGMTLDAALSEARDALFLARHRGADTDRLHNPVTNTEALLELATRSLQSAPSTRAERHKHYVHLDVDALTADRAGTPYAALSNGTPIPPSIAKYLNCDTLMQPVWETDNTSIGVGRTSRTIPDRLRRIVSRRDHGRCRVPGCEATIIEIHHVIHWLDGGVTETWNLVSLCPAHHRMHHSGNLGITGNPDLTDSNCSAALAFTDQHGRPLRLWPTPKPPPDDRSATPDVGSGIDNAQGPSDPDGTPGTDSSPGCETRHRYQHPSGERLYLYWMSSWRHPAEYRFLNKTDTAAWQQHQQRRHSINR